MRIVTDSTSDLPAAIAQDLDITVAPLSIQFGDKTYIDREDVDAETFYRMMATEKEHARTAQPAVGRFEEAYRALAAEGHEIVTIVLSSTLSGTFSTASLAARNVPEARVTVIDSRVISMALGSLVMRAARMARAGKTAAEIESVVSEMIPRLDVFIMVDTLTYLQRGGRLGRASSLVGSMLNIKPIITLRDGEVVPLQRVRTRGKALQEMVELVRARQPIEEIYVLHTVAPEVAAEFAYMVQPLYDNREPLIMPLGPVIGAHVGPGAIGVIVLRAAG